MLLLLLLMLVRLSMLLLLPWRQAGVGATAETIQQLSCVKVC
jgi:hypothetical protein